MTFNLMLSIEILNSLDISLSHNDIYACWFGIMMCYDSTRRIPETCCFLFHLINFTRGMPVRNRDSWVWLCNLCHKQVGSFRFKSLQTLRHLSQVEENWPFKSISITFYSSGETFMGTFLVIYLKFYKFSWCLWTPFSFNCNFIGRWTLAFEARVIFETGYLHMWFTIKGVQTFCRYENFVRGVLQEFLTLWQSQLEISPKNFTHKIFHA